MKKKILSSYCITIMLFCQIALCFLTAINTASAANLTENQAAAISSNCRRMKDTLKTVQASDSRARVYLGSYYERLLNKYLVPLNLRLVKNNKPNTELVSAQTAFSTYFTNFRDDYTEYQRTLETLTSFDCINHPSEFYDLLTETREKRKIMVTDVADLKKAISSIRELVKGLKNGKE